MQAAFLQHVKTTLEALTADTSKVFAAVHITRELDPLAAQKIPRWPMAQVYDVGGALDSTGTLESRELRVTVFEPSLRDHTGEHATLTLARIGALVRDALIYGTTDTAVFYIADREEPKQLDGTVQAHTWRFSYILDLTYTPPPPEEP
jgi:hypothetical protein